MGISNNSPTMSYVHISGTSVVWNNELYMVQDFATNKKYIYWNADMPHQLNASNIMPNRSTKQYLVIVNDNGMHTLVPSTSDDFSISFEGNSNQAIRDRVFGLYEKNEQFGEKFVAIEQNIDRISSTVGGIESDTNFIHEEISRIEQKADNINLEVKDITKKYNDDKEMNKLREDLNASIIKLNSTLGVFKGELTDYFKNSEISSEEKIKINTQLELLVTDKANVDKFVDEVRLIAERNNQEQDVVAIDSAKNALQIAHDNLYNNITNAAIDNIITPTENTIIIDSFAKYNLRVNELKNTCDDIIILGVGGAIIEELANINIKSNEIKLSVSEVESNFENDIGDIKDTLKKQSSEISLMKDEISLKVEKEYVDNTVSGLDKVIEETFNDALDKVSDLNDYIDTAFKDGILSDAEKEVIKSQIETLELEKADILSQVDALKKESSLATSEELANLQECEEVYKTTHAQLIDLLNKRIEGGTYGIFKCIR